MLTQPTVFSTHRLYNKCMDYRRIYQPGGTYFFTLVTFNRQKILANCYAYDLLMRSIKRTQKSYPFNLMAYCILPDHLHMVWVMPENDADFSTRMRLIKSGFSKYYRSPKSEARTPSRIKKNERAVWQRRFWEHLIRDEEDLKEAPRLHFLQPRET